MSSRSNPAPLPSIRRERSSPIWFFTGFFAVILAGIAKIAIADYFDK